MKSVFRLTALALGLAFIYSRPFHAQGFEYEGGIGPQVTWGIITDYNVGIVGDNKPKSNSLPVGYSLQFSVRNNSLPVQVGLQLKNDYTRINIYLPLWFPSDVNSKKFSRWNNYYEAMRLGIGGHARYSFHKSFVQLGVSYLSEISGSSNSKIFTASLNTTEDVDGANYSKGSGFTGDLLFGSGFVTKPKYQLNVSIGIQYSFYTQQYDDDIFLQQWTVRPVNAFLMLSYLLRKPIPQVTK